jgi:NAD(P)-dependent dehydrogenase (short-subunit alcohol dehydrogenase family)
MPVLTSICVRVVVYVRPLASLSRETFDVCLGYTMTAVDTEIREVEKMFAVNVFGPMRMVRFFHRMLVESKGTNVNIGSVGGIVPYVYGGKAERMALLARG